MPTGTNQHALAITAKPQSAYLTATAKTTAAPYSWRRIIQSQFAPTDYSVNVQKNVGAATGTFFPNESRTISHDVSRPMPVELNSIDAVRFLYGACGQLSSALAFAGVYQHTIKLLDLNVSQALPAYGIAEKAGTGLDQELVGCNVQRMLISIDGIGIVTSEITWSGSGKRTSPSGLIFEPTASYNVPAPAGLSYWKGSQVSLGVADSGTLANPVNYCANRRLNRCTIEIQNTLSDGYRPCAGDFQIAGNSDSGAVRSERYLLNQTVTPTIEVRVEPGSVELQYLQEQRKLQLQILLTGPPIGITGFNHVLIYLAPITTYNAVQTGEAESFLIYTITAEPLANLATGDVYTFVVQNDQPGTIYV